jgi:hypothetical protein
MKIKKSFPWYWKHFRLQFLKDGSKTYVYLRSLLSEPHVAISLEENNKQINESVF